MSRKSRIPLGARLRRSRAFAVCLGRRRFYLSALDRPRGRPSIQLGFLLQAWKKPVLEYDPALYDDQCLLDCKHDLILDCCQTYLYHANRGSGWFEVVERGAILGTNVFIRVRRYDLFVVAPDLLEKRLGFSVPFSDRRKPFQEVANA